MWAYGQHFRIEKIDHNRVTFDYGVMVNFHQAIHECKIDKNLIEGTLQHVGKIQQIIQLDYRSFQCVVFICKWFDTLDRRTILHDDNSEYYLINYIKYLAEDKEPYVLPQHCSQVCFYLYVEDETMQFVINIDPR